MKKISVLAKQKCGRYKYGKVLGKIWTEI